MNNEFLNQNKSWCIFPFIHLHVNESDVAKPCCFGNNIKKIDENFDFYQDTEYQKIRELMLLGQPVAQCIQCYQIEKSGGVSFRIKESTEWMEKLNIDSVDQIATSLISYDIRNDNTCNLSCRICHPGASSQLEKEYKKLNWIYPATSRKSQLHKIVDYHSVQRVLVAGGEPTIMPEFQLFLEQCIKHNQQDVEIMVVTNATNINHSLLDLLKQFTNLHFTVSIDGFDQVNRYIRWPSDWKTIVKNIHRLRSITEHVCFNVCVNIWNVTSIQSLLKFLESEFSDPVVLLNEGVPNRMANISPFLHPDKIMAVEELKKCKSLNNYCSDDYFKNQIDYFINTMTVSSVDLQQLKTFFEYNDQLDQSRNVRLQDYIPELHQARMDLNIL